jgi:hypothetical protein
MWFDDVTLDVPTELPWRRIDGENFTHYWLNKPYPEGSIEYQQQLFDNYARRLGIPKKHRTKIAYYLYADSASALETLGKRQLPHVDYAQRTIHSTNPVEDHGVVHLLTEPYGVLPKVLSEGTFYYLLEELDGQPILPLAQKLLADGQLPELREVLGISSMKEVESTPLLAAAVSFVAYLIEVVGPSEFLELHRNSNPNDYYDGFARAFERTYDAPLDQVEENWRRTLGRADFSQGEGAEPKE